MRLLATLFGGMMTRAFQSFNSLIEAEARAHAAEAELERLRAELARLKQGRRLRR